MSEVTRCELEDIMVPDGTGDWVMHSDHLTATAELRRELEEVKAKAVSYAKEVRECRRNWDRKTQEAVDATKENLALKREVEELRDLRSKESSLELAAAVIKWMSSVNPMDALRFGTKENSLADAIYAALNQREK